MVKRLMQHQYFAKQVAELVGIDDPLRVQLYSVVESYGINPLQLGAGRGSRKIYGFEDVLRIAVAEQLSRFGFNAAAIGSALGKIKRSELDPESGSFYLVQNRTLSSADFDWEVITREAEKQRRERPPATFMLDLTATVVPVWQRAEELASSGEKQ